MHPSDAVKILFGEAADLQRVTAAEVKSAFRRRVRAFHPDSAQNVTQHCGEAVSSLISARDILIEHLASARKKAAGPAPARPSNPFSSYARPTIVKPVRPVVEKIDDALPRRLTTILAISGGWARGCPAVAESERVIPLLVPKSGG